jgi:cold shock protein
VFLDGFIEGYLSGSLKQAPAKGKSRAGAVFPVLSIVPTKPTHYANRGHTQGTIKKVVHDRGFGFIRAQSGEEIFFHRSSLKQGNFDSLAEGHQVEFDLERGEKGPRASNVRVTGIGV